MKAYETLRDHVEFARSKIVSRGKFYSDRGLKISSTLHTLLWQNRRYIVDVTTRALMSLSHHGNDESPLLKKWRSSSQKNSLISRIVQYELITKPSASLSKLAAAAEPEGGRESVRRALKIAVELGLLDHTDGQYSMTDEYANELFDRTVLRLRDADVVEFAKLVIAIDELERLNQFPKYPRQEEHPLATPSTLTEAIGEGKYRIEDD